jgi:hypothetical protein
MKNIKILNKNKQHKSGKNMQKEKDRSFIYDMKKVWVEKGITSEDEARQLANAMEEIDFLSAQLKKLLFNEVAAATSNFDSEKLLDSLSEYDLRAWEIKTRFERVKVLINSIVEKNSK